MTMKNHKKEIFYFKSFSFFLVCVPEWQKNDMSVLFWFVKKIAKPLIPFHVQPVSCNNFKIAWHLTFRFSYLNLISNSLLFLFSGLKTCAGLFFNVAKRPDIEQGQNFDGIINAKWDQNRQSCFLSWNFCLSSLWLFSSI